MFKLEPQIAPETTKCQKCGRTLRDPESVRRGIGPVCSGITPRKYQEMNQMSLDFDKPELIICMDGIGYDAQGNQIVSGKDEIELSANILAMFTEPDRAMAREFAEVIQGATRGVVRANTVEKFIKEWRR